MSRERELLRNNFEWLDEKYPGKEFFTWSEAAKIVGIDVRTLMKYYRRGKEPFISKMRLASILS